MTTTIPRLLQERARQHPDRLALRLYLEDKVVCWSYAELSEQAQRAAGALYECGVRPGDRVLLLTVEVDDSVRAFLGSWFLGATPSAIGLPLSLQELDAFTARTQEIAARIGAKALILGRGLREFLPEARPNLSLIDAGALASSASFSPFHLVDEPAQDAILQLSSGTTGRSKVVRISHRALLANLGQMQRAFDITEQDSGVTWLPMYHDMGLIGGFLLPLYSGASGMSMMSTLSFRENPMRWLQIVSETRATTSAAPTSAYAICARLVHRTKEMSLDLSHWTRALVGAEPVLPTVLQAFSRAYARYGFSAKAHMGIYGLAEATLSVTSPVTGVGPLIDRVLRSSLEEEQRATQAPADAPEHLVRSFVGLGAPLDETKIQVQRGGRVLSEREVGEVFLRGTSMFSGYLAEPERTASRWKEGWYSTGDIGYLAQGQLFLTGRAEDFIIRGGRNIDPHEIEDVAAQVTGVRGGGTLACGIMREDIGTESITLIAESTLEGNAADELKISLKKFLLSRGLEVDEVKIVPVGWVPKTTSGKKMRQEAKSRLLAERL